MRIPETVASVNLRILWRLCLFAIPTIVGIKLLSECWTKSRVTRLDSNLAPTVHPPAMRGGELLEMSTVSTISTDSMTPVVRIEPVHALDIYGYSNMSLMKPKAYLRPLFDFTLQPWKISANESRYISKNFLQQNVNWSMIVAVKSLSSHVALRQFARETWGSFRYLNGVRFELIFLVGNAENAESEMNLLKENGKYGDILQINLTDVYVDVGYKTLAGMQWISQHFPPNWIYTCADDDMMPDLINLIDDLEMLMEKSRKLLIATSERNRTDSADAFAEDAITRLPIHCGYRYESNAPADRGKFKWSVGRSLYPLEKYPPLCFGGWYSMPVSMNSELYRISRLHKFFFLDDTWITGLLRLSYFKWRNISTYFGLDKSDDKIGIWPQHPNVVRHLKTHYRLSTAWKEMELKMRNEAKKFIRTIT